MIFIAVLVMIIGCAACSLEIWYLAAGCAMMLLYCAVSRLYDIHMELRKIREAIVTRGR